MNRLHRYRSSRSRRTKQRGAVAIIVGLTLVVMVGFIGLALDGGHLYLTKTELQNGADACALAASYELTGAPAISVPAFDRAEAAGKLVGTGNKVGFQGAAIAAGDITVAFGTSLSAGGSWVSAAAATPASRYVRCTIQQTGITPWFMQVLGFGPQTVASLATATLSPSQSNCALPMGICVRSGPNFGYTVGEWVAIDFDSGPLTGNFRWVDFTPPAGGLSELVDLFKGSGQCSLPPPITTGSCPVPSSSVPTGCVGQPGAGSGLEAAYNSRFGVYKNGVGNPQATTAPPDFTGYAYAYDGVVGNWSLGSNAYAGTSGSTPNFKAARAAHQPTVDVTGVTPPFIGPSYSPTPQPGHVAYGADRRIVTIPIVDCTSFGGGSTVAPIRAYACVLLLDPYRKNSSGTHTKIEFLGLASDPGSPCASSGIAGTSTSPGPLVPALVQ